MTDDTLDDSDDLFGLPHTPHYSNPLVGKYFIGVHDGVIRSGRISATISSAHYLISFAEQDDEPISQAVVTLCTISGEDEEDAVAWYLFETVEQCQAYQRWLDDIRSETTETEPTDAT